MNAFWWYEENFIAGMARPGFNSVHFTDLKFDEAILLGWIGQYASGDVALESFRHHLETYVPRIYKFHKGAGPDSVQVFNRIEGLVEVLSRLKDRMRIIRDFYIENDKLSVDLCNDHLRKEMHYLKERGINTIVSLTEKHHSAEILKDTFALHHISIQDLCAPTRDQAEYLADVIKSSRGRGDKLAVHCLAGIGRTSTMIIAAHVLLGEKLEILLDRLAKQNPRFAFTSSQADFVRSLVGFS